MSANEPEPTVTEEEVELFLTLSYLLEVTIERERPSRFSWEQAAAAHRIIDGLVELGFALPMIHRMWLFLGEHLIDDLRVRPLSQQEEPDQEPDADSGEA